VIKAWDPILTRSFGLWICGPSGQCRTGSLTSFWQGLGLVAIMRTARSRHYRRLAVRVSPAGPVGSRSASVNGASGRPMGNCRLPRLRLASTRLQGVVRIPDGSVKSVRERRPVTGALNVSSDLSQARSATQTNLRGDGFDGLDLGTQQALEDAFTRAQQPAIPLGSLSTKPWTQVRCGESSLSLQIPAALAINWMLPNPRSICTFAVALRIRSVWANICGVEAPPTTRRPRGAKVRRRFYMFLSQIC